jgi:hypothetical protein
MKYVGRNSLSICTGSWVCVVDEHLDVWSQGLGVCEEFGSYGTSSAMCKFFWSGHFAPQSVTVGRNGIVTSAVGSSSEVCAFLVQSSV